MGILFVMKNWAKPSELWLQRQIEMLEPHIALLACPAPKENRWRGRIPTLKLQDVPPSWPRRFAHHVGLNVWQPPRRTSIQCLKQAIESSSVTAILIHYLKFAIRFESAWSATTKPVFIHCHGYDITWDMRSTDQPDRPMFGPDYIESARRLAQKAILIAPSRTSAQRLYDIGIPPERVAVKYVGTEVPLQPPRRPFHKGDVTVLYLGRLVDCKGPDLVIRAFALACQNGLKGRLIIAGDGELAITCKLIRARSSYSDRITFLGAVDGQTGAALRADADIFTAHHCFGPLTHQEEASAVAFMEAMACALPVTSGRSGGLPEIVSHGEDGLLFEPGDIEAHAEALIRLAQDHALRQRMGIAGWQKAKERYSIERERTEFRRILGINAASGQ